MSVLHVTGLKKTLGAREVLAGVDVRVERGEKVGCVGRNGEGKTTLLRVIEGEEPADSGTVHVAKGARVGYVAQHPEFPPGATVRAVVEGGLDEVHALEAELERLSHEMAEAAGVELERLVHRHGELSARMEFLGGWESERRVESVLRGVGLREELWDRDASALSGGETSRTAMARVLVSVPDLLLLDEPTNHLDLAGIEWLEGYLASIRSGVLVVSHDRRLLDNVCGSILELERGRVTRYPGNYAKYVDLKHERYVAALRAWEQQQEAIKKEEAFVAKHIGGTRTGEAKGRQRRLQSIVRLERPHDDVRRPVIRMAKVERGGERVLAARGLAVGHGSPLFSGLELAVRRGERIGLVGPNGCGKSTLLRVLAGRAAPLAGELEAGHGAVAGYYDQDVADLADDGTPFGEIRREHPLWTDLEVRSHLARFLFRGSAVDTPVRALSGGERARLVLAKLVLSAPSWLALDEPTNHLDLPSRTALEEMLSEFPGAVVVVSHDRELLDRLCGRIWWIRGGAVRELEGNYTAARAQLAAEEQAAADAARAGAERRERERKRAAGAPEPAADGAAARAPRNPWRFQRLEEEIIALEDRKGALLEALGTEEVYKDAERARGVQVELSEVERDLAEKNAEWETWA